MITFAFSFLLIVILVHSLLEFWRGSKCSSEELLLWLNSVNCILHFGRDPIISFAGLLLSSFGSFASMFVFLAHLHLSGQHVVSAVSLVSPAAKKTTKLWQDFTLDDNSTRSENLDVQRRWQAKSHDKIFLLKIVITAQVQICLNAPLYQSNQSGQRTSWEVL